MTDETAKRFSHVKFGVRTDVGRRRKNNEDSHGEWPEQGVFCVADGMGGAQDGEVASRAVVESLSGLIPRLSKFNPPVSQPDRVRAVAAGVDAASAWIKSYADSQGKKGCGSTFVGVALDPADGSRATALHAGDSRVYRVRGKKIVQITRDHSVAEMAGVKDERQLNPMFRSMILRAVGVKSQVETEETPFDLREGDWILICSDGLSRMVEDPELAAICAAASNPQAAADALVDRANELGGKDNVTVVALRVGAVPQGPRPVHARLSQAETKTLFERGPGDGEPISVSTLETTASDELPTTEDTASGRGVPGRGDDRTAAEDESVLPDDEEDDGGAAAAPPPVPAPAPARKQVPASAMPVADAAQPAKRKDAVFTAVASVLAVIAVVACGVRGWQVRQDRIAATAKDAAEEAEKQRLAEEARKAEEAERQRKAAEEAEKQRLAEEARKAEEAERQRKAAEEAEKQRLAEEARKAEEARRKAEEAEKQRLAEEARKAEEAERQRKAAEEAEKLRLAEEARRKAEAARREAETALAAAQETFAGKSAALIARINEAGESGPYEAEREDIVAEFAGALADAAGILPDDNTKLVRAKGVLEEEKGKIGGALGKLGERLREAQARAQGEAEEREREAQEREREAEARAQDDAASLFPFAEGKCPQVEVLEKWREDYDKSIGRWVPFDTLESRYKHLRDFAEAAGKEEKFSSHAKSFKKHVAKALDEKGINEAWLGKEQASRTFGSMFGDVLAGWEKAAREAGDAQAAAVAERCRRAYGACTATAGREAEDKSIALAKALAAMAELVESHWPLLNGWLQAHESGFVENSAKRWSNDFLKNPGGADSGKWLNVVSNAVRSVLTAAGGAD